MPRSLRTDTPDAEDLVTGIRRSLGRRWRVDAEGGNTYTYVLARDDGLRVRLENEGDRAWRAWATGPYLPGEYAQPLIQRAPTFSPARPPRDIARELMTKLVGPCEPLLAAAIERMRERAERRERAVTALRLLFEAARLTDETALDAAIRTVRRGGGWDFYVGNRDRARRQAEGLDDQGRDDQGTCHVSIRAEGEIVLDVRTMNAALVAKLVRVRARDDVEVWSPPEAVSSTPTPGPGTGEPVPTGAGLTAFTRDLSRSLRDTGYR